MRCSDSLDRAPAPFLSSGMSEHSVQDAERNLTDLIDRVPPREVARLAADPRLAVFGGDGIFVAYLNPDIMRERVPYVEDKQGRPLERSPLRDPRVREALSLAIDRQGIVDRVMHGQARPAAKGIERAPHYGQDGQERDEQPGLHCAGRTQHHNAQDNGGQRHDHAHGRGPHVTGHQGGGQQGESRCQTGKPQTGGRVCCVWAVGILHDLHCKAAAGSGRTAENR